MHAAGEGSKGVAECPFDFYKKWVNDPKGAQDDVEALTRTAPGVDGCPVYDLPTEGANTPPSKKRKA